MINIYCERQGSGIFAEPLNTLTNLAVRNNVVYSREGTVEGVVLRDYSTQTTEAIRTDGGWTVANPRILEFETGKVRYAPNSPVLKLGVTPIDVSNAGRQSPAQLKVPMAQGPRSRCQIMDDCSISRETGIMRSPSVMCIALVCAGASAKSHKSREVPLSDDMLATLARLRDEAPARRPRGHRHPRTAAAQRAAFSRDHIFVTRANTPWRNNLLRSFYARVTDRSKQQAIGALPFAYLKGDWKFPVVTGGRSDVSPCP